MIYQDVFGILELKLEKTDTQWWCHKLNVIVKNFNDEIKKVYASFACIPVYRLSTTLIYNKDKAYYSNI
jgi:hypothetical protein